MSSDKTYGNIIKASEHWKNKHQLKMSRCMEYIRESDPLKRIEILDGRLGKGKGAEKERARLIQKMMEAKKAGSKTQKPEFKKQMILHCESVESN